MLLVGSRFHQGVQRSLPVLEKPLGECRHNYWYGKSAQRYPRARDSLELDTEIADTITKADLAEPSNVDDDSQELTSRREHHCFRDRSHQIDRMSVVRLSTFSHHEAQRAFSLTQLTTHVPSVRLRVSCGIMDEDGYNLLTVYTVYQGA